LDERTHSDYDHCLTSHQIKADMGFTFQQPGNSSTLHAIGKAAHEADFGIGVFAYASPSGVRAFFDIPEILALLKEKRKFHLIVGVDAITSASTLLMIEDLQNKFGKKVLTAEAFYHEHPSSTFHPKFVQFGKGKKLYLVTGSGNLTSRGLGINSSSSPAPGNWEAFSSETLTGSDAQKVQADISTWLAAYRTSGLLRQLSDEEVKSRAMENGMVRFTTSKASAKGKKAAPKTGAVAPVLTAAGETVNDSRGILIRELPRNRPGQADIGKVSLSEFFGYAGSAKYVLLQHVALDDIVGQTESIRLFVNDSQNYRLELHAMSGLKYEIGPDDSRMVLVATKLDDRSFRYCIVPVNSGEHPKLLTLLGPILAGRRRMREKRISPEELVDGWKDVPSNLIPTLSLSVPV
jgi:hypothetical protein